MGFLSDRTESKPTDGSHGAFSHRYKPEQLAGTADLSFLAYQPGVRHSRRKTCPRIEEERGLVSGSRRCLLGAETATDQAVRIECGSGSIRARPGRV